MNLNDRFSVKLTKTGARIYNDYIHRASVLIPKYNPVYLTEGDKLVSQLWELFQIFGDNIYFGMIESPFQNCELKPND